MHDLTITQLPSLTVLDPRELNQEQLAQAEAIFERFKKAEFLPANEAYQDDARKALDRAIYGGIAAPSRSGPRTARHFTQAMVRRTERPWREEDASVSLTRLYTSTITMILTAIQKEPCHD